MAVRPVAAYEVWAEVPIWTPPPYILYPVTPTLSVLAVQERLIEETPVTVPVRPVGIEGGVVSAAEVTVTVTFAAVPVFPAASLATAERVWVPRERVAGFRKTW